MIAEAGSTVRHIYDLNFGQCQLAVQAPAKSGYKSAKVRTGAPPEARGPHAASAHVARASAGRHRWQDLVGKRIVTSFPHVATKFFRELAPDVETKINYVSGSVEVACALGLADGIGRPPRPLCFLVVCAMPGIHPIPCTAGGMRAHAHAVDLVETGTTMRAAGLEIVETVMRTEAVLISNPNAKHQELVERMSKRIIGVVFAAKYSMITYNIPRSLLAVAKQITPGNRSPTVSPLEDPDWVAISAMVQKSKAPDIMDQLQSIGAVDILLTDIHNCRV